jgi:hypothetical protein
MTIAYQTVADSLAAGATPAEALRRVKSAAPFSGFRETLAIGAGTPPCRFGQARDGRV